jgi:hypothetical protein
MRDLLHNISVVKLLQAIVVNNDTEGTPANGVIDRNGYDSCVAIAMIGISGDTLSGSLKLDVKVQDSDDGTTWAAVTETSYIQNGSGSAAPDSNGIVATIDDAAEDDVVISVGYVGPKQYFRLLIDTTGTHTNGTPIAMLGILGHPAVAPVSNT